jgi:glycosyltransferase involved in cell wall biosynthesis
MTRHPEDCSYRRRTRKVDGWELADCLLLEAMTGGDVPDLHTVRRDVCVSCCDMFPPGEDQPNPAVASLLYDVTDRILRAGGVPGCDVAKAERLRTHAERHLTQSWRPPSGTVACDVVLCCTESNEDTDRAVRSVLEQEGAHIFLHLVNDGGGASEIVSRYAGRSHVFTYSNAVRRGPFRTLHDLIPRLRSAYVAVQDPSTFSVPRRIRYSVAMLEVNGGEFLAGPLSTPAGLFRAERPGLAFRRYLPPQTLVCRRSSLVDMGGIMDRPEDSDAELVFRGCHERRETLLAEDALVVATGPLHLGAVGPPPEYADLRHTLRRHAIGFAQESVECDVVLPFHGHLEFLAESLPSVLEQTGAEVVVHLIDDATPGGAEEVFRYWGTHPRIRLYRNSRNLGQFTTFNNVFPYLETNLVAIQDADDISLPHRLHLAGNHLRLADADFFGGRFETFEYGNNRADGDGLAGRPAHPSRDTPPYWASRYPKRYEQSHFLQNTTAVMRKGSFEALRGFSDYGDVDRNKCGLDTEFFVRAFHAGCRFAVSHDVVVRYRWHPESVTRNSETGWGTQPRYWSTTENERRFKLYHRGPFDARALGSLQQSLGQTQRVV